MRAVLVNGPPGSGKDEACRALEAHLDAEELKFSWPLKLSIPSMFNAVDSDESRCDVWRRLDLDKETPRPEFFGMSWRDAQIWLSERVMKPNFGEDVFGQIAVQHVKRYGAFAGAEDILLAISDSGFEAESLPVIEYVGADNCLLIRAHRAGHTFAGDSRSYLELPIKSVDLKNDGSLQEWHDAVVACVEEWIGEDGQC